MNQNGSRVWIDAYPGGKRRDLQALLPDKSVFEALKRVDEENQKESADLKRRALVTSFLFLVSV